MTRNQRKRLAKARHDELLTAVSNAFALENQRLTEVRLRREALDELNGYNDAGTVRQRGIRERIGKVVGGQFQSRPMPEPVKRSLSLNKATGKMIERRKRAI